MVNDEFLHVESTACTKFAHVTWSLTIVWSNLSTTQQTSPCGWWGPYSFFLLASHVCHHAHNGHHFVFTITFWQHVCIRSQSHRKDLAVKTVFQTPLCSSLHRPHVVPLLQIDNIQRQQSYLLRKKANMILGKAVRKRCRKSSDSTSATASHIYRVNSAV